jgi:hypothetical protein
MAAQLRAAMCRPQPVDCAQRSFASGKQAGRKRKISEKLAGNMQSLPKNS